MRKKNTIVVAALLGLALPAYGAHFTVSFYEFSGDMPRVPFEATTFEQDDLIKEARMRWDNEEAESVAACDLLIADETLPFELRCWAVRQKMTLCTYAGRCAEALDTGRAWLRDHGTEDPHALYIRRVMAHILVRRCRPEFVLLYDLEGIREIFDDFFANHPADNLYVINAHYDYGEVLEKLAAVDEALRYEAARHFFMASEAITEYMAREDLPPRRRQECERFLKVCRSSAANLLSERWMPSPVIRATAVRLSEQQELAQEQEPQEHLGRGRDGERP
ncbi:MAG TPA: hypothetical protein ENN29_07205 [Candidatus Hydrogenedentes bacterium]|nr:hypothetical protein [Candidatus Hydrogenedentota bacterium]